MVQLDMSSSFFMSDNWILPQRSLKASQSIKWKVIERDDYWTRHISKFAKAQIPPGEKWHWCEWFSTATGNAWFLHSLYVYVASTSKHHTSSHRTCKYDIIHYKGFFQSSFLQETRWIPPGDQPTCSSSAANSVAPWKSTAPNPPRHRREWFECRCRWPSHCPRRQTSQLRQIDFELSASMERRQPQKTYFWDA